MDFKILDTPIEIRNTSVVVIAQSHNPTILHPSFLKNKEIVPSDWKLASGVDSVVCSLPISIVKYENGFVFTVDANKFQLVDNNPSEDFSTSKVPEIAKKYIEKLPEVSYKSIGINIGIFIEHPSAETFLINHFLITKVFEDIKPQAIRLNLMCPIDQTRLYFSFDTITGKKGILLNANYHTDILPTNALEEAEKAIMLFSNRCCDCIEKTKMILEGKD